MTVEIRPQDVKRVRAWRAWTQQDLADELETDAVTVHRAQPHAIGGRRIRVLTPKDLIIFKLVAGRLRDYKAVAAILNSHPTTLDREFIETASPSSTWQTGGCAPSKKRQEKLTSSPEVQPAVSSS